MVSSTSALSSNISAATSNASAMAATQHRRYVDSGEGGIFAGKGLLASPLALFLVQATIIIALSRLIHYPLQKLRQPRVIAEIIGGICLGPSVLGHLPYFTETIFPQHSLPTLNLVASFGLVMYMFLMGLELDTGILLRGATRFAAISFAGTVLPGLLGILVSYCLYEYLLEPSVRDATPFSSFLPFTIVAMAITAFPVLARILTEKKLLSTTVGLMTISAAAVGDIAAWLLLALTISIVNAGNPFSVLYILLCVTIYAALLLLPVRMLVHKLFSHYHSRRNGRVVTPFVLAVIFLAVFLSAWTTEWMGIHAIFGAFVVGIVIPRLGGLTMELTRKLEDFIGIALLPLYFASSGLKTKMALLTDWHTAAFCLLVIVVACAGKIIGCSLAARFTGFPWRESLSIGVLMNTKGLVELIVLNIGLDAGVINERIFVIMVVMALVTTFMTSPILAYIYPSKYHARKLISPAGAGSAKKRTLAEGLNGVGSLKEVPDADDHVLLYLRDIDSTPIAANLAQQLRGSLPPLRKLHLVGFKAFTDMDSSSNIMVGTQTEYVVESDHTLKMFRFFGKLLGANAKCLVALSHLDSVGVEVDRAAEAEQCGLVMLPWESDAAGSDQRTAVLSILSAAHHATVAICIDRRLVGTQPLLSGATPFTNIVVPFTGSHHALPNERAAMQLGFRLCRYRPATAANTSPTMPGVGGGVRLTLVHLQRVNVEANGEESQLLHSVHAMIERETELHNDSANIIAHGGHQRQQQQQQLITLQELKYTDAESCRVSLKKAMEKAAFDLAIVGHTMSALFRTHHHHHHHHHQHANGGSSSSAANLGGGAGASEGMGEHVGSSPALIGAPSPTLPTPAPMAMKKMIRQLSVRGLADAASDEEKLFGSLGEWLLSSGGPQNVTAGPPSLVVVHQPLQQYAGDNNGNSNSRELPPTLAA